MAIYVMWTVHFACWITEATNTYSEYVIHTAFPRQQLLRERIAMLLLRIRILPVLLISKGKAVPLQAWSGPEGSRKLRFPDFMTTAQVGGKVVNLTHRPHLPPGNSPGTHFC